ALVDDVPELLPRNAVELARRPLVDQVEERRERVAQAHAAAATVADVEDAPHLGDDLRLLPILRALPLDRMPRRRFQAAFALAHFVSRRARRALSGSGWRASARPWRAS